MATRTPLFETSYRQCRDVPNVQYAEGPGALRQAIPDFLELTGDEGVAQVGRMDVEIKRPGIPQPPLNRHESLPTQGWCVQIDDRDP